jgi:hypothetical protein
MPPLAAETLLELPLFQLFNSDYVLSAVESLHGILIQVLSRCKRAQRMMSVPRMFGGRPSDLRKFSLWDYICWPHNTFHKLTHLSLHEQLAAPTFDEFLDMLKDSESESRLTVFGGSTPQTSRSGDPTLNLDSSCDSFKAAGSPTLGLHTRSVLPFLRLEAYGFSAQDSGVHHHAPFH